MANIIKARIPEQQEVKARLVKDRNINVHIGDTNWYSSDDYNKLENKPKIEMVELEGNKGLEDFGLIDISREEMKNLF